MSTSTAIPCACGGDVSGSCVAKPDSIQLKIPKESSATAPDQKNLTTTLCTMLAQQTAVWQQLMNVLQKTDNAPSAWHSGMMVEGAKDMGRRLLNPTLVEGDETLENTFTIHLPSKSVVTGLFLHVLWPVLSGSKAVCNGNFVIEVDANLNKDVEWRTVTTVAPCDYGLRINTEDEPWHTSRIRVTFKRGCKVGTPALDNYELNARNLAVQTKRM